MKIELAKGKQMEVEVIFSCSPEYCKGCGKEIIWTKTKNGKMMPVSELGNGKFVSHFYDCPKAKIFKKII